MARQISSTFETVVGATTMHVVELYKIAQLGMTSFLYTDSNVGLTYDSEWYQPWPIKRNKISFSSDMKVDQFELIMAKDWGFTNAVRKDKFSGSPLFVTRVNADLPDTDNLLLFDGEVADVTVDEANATIRAQTLDFLNLELPLREIQVACNWRVYALAYCGLSLDNYVVGLSSGGTLTLNPDPDTYITQGVAGASYGLETNLSVSGQTNSAIRSLLQFDSTEIFQTATITSASLQLFNYEGEDARNITAARITGLTWDGQTRWNNQPEYTVVGSTTATLAGVVAGTTGTWVEWIVTDQVQEAFDSNSQIAEFILLSDDESEGAVGSIDYDIIDSSTVGHTMTAVADAALDETYSVFGDSSLIVDGTGDYVTTPDSSDWAFGAGDFTLEYRYRFNANPGGQKGMLSQWVSSTGWTITKETSGFGFYFTAGGGVEGNTIAYTFSTAQWYAFSLVREGNALRRYVDGSQIGATFDMTGKTLDDVSAVLEIGAIAGGAVMNGNYDEIRISDSARYGAGSYVLSPVAFTNDSNTLLLMHCDAQVVVGTTLDNTNFYSQDYTTDVDLRPILSVRYEKGMNVIDIDQSERNKIVIPRLTHTNPNSYQAGAVIPVDYFRGGYIKSLEGMNDYVHRHIVGMTMSDTALGLSWDTLLVLPPFPYDLEATSAIEVAPGCDHNLEDCSGKFNNQINYGGFPWTPNFDQIY